MLAVDTTIATNYYSGVAHFECPRQDSTLGGDFFWLDDSPRVRQTTHGFNRLEVCDTLFAPAHVLYHRPILMRDRTEQDRRAKRPTSYAAADVLTLGHHGGPDIVRRAEAPSWATLPGFPSGRATVASYPEQSRQRPIPVDRVGMAFGLGVVTTDRVWW